MSTEFPYEKKEIILQVKDVSLSFNGKPILCDMNASIKDIFRPGMRQGQVVALLGPSGIGKTQTFRILAGLQKPTNGTVLVTDKLIPVEVGMVGVVAQSYPLFKRMTVKDNLMVAVKLRKCDDKEARDRVAEMLNLYGLLDRQNAYPSQLSGGQRQRVAIAQQILSSEHFLLMDEPFSGLDPVMKDTACHAILKMANLDDLNTVIVVTHDISSAVEIADTIWLMGRRFDSNGVSLGATIVKEYDLIEYGLAWHPDISKIPAFHTMVTTIRNDFNSC